MADGSRRRAEVTVTSGATEALFCAIHAVVRPGDEVILLEPAYDSYEPAVELAGGRVVRVPLQRPHFGVDWQRVRDAMTARTRLLIVNSPHNPTGAVFSAADLDALGEVLRDSPALVLADEVYEHIVFGGRRHAGLLASSGTCRTQLRRLVVRQDVPLHGLENRLLRGAPRLDGRVPQGAPVRPVCRRDADAGRPRRVPRGVPGHALGLAAFYERKRDHFGRAARAHAVRIRAGGREPISSSPTIRAISDLPDIEFARWLTREVGVAAIPVSVFSASPPGERLVRFCFAKGEATLDAAGERLSALQASGGDS